MLLLKSSDAYIVIVLKDPSLGLELTVLDTVQMQALCLEGKGGISSIKIWPGGILKVLNFCDISILVFVV